MGINLYKRDDRDVRFVLKEHLGIDRLLQYDRYRHFTMSDIDMVLECANDIAKNEIAPTFQDADRVGARFENGKVYAPEGFHRLWSLFREGGWFALVNSPEYGGQGLPVIVSEAVQEFFMSANFSFGCYSGMGAGNGVMIEKFGTEKQRDLFVRKLYSGEWGACMCLTEPDAGSDAHMIATKARPDGDVYAIEGTKIFITSGDHDLTENIVHMVLARIEGAPGGAKGVSLFAVPKIRVNDDGTLGEGNDVQCTGIEHKMGLNGSATCVIQYGENGRCRGHLIGKPGMGLAYMFDMVNLARMAVGLESVAFGANIYANVLEYAKNRIQGTPFGKKGGGRVRIIEHADVRRMLMNIKALTEGMRALVYKAYFMEDLARACPDAEERKRASYRLELLTPIVKAYCSDRVFEICRDGIQILGGYGFCREYPVEQYARDCKILSIWDGTNYVQSIDLVGRKLSMDGGKAFREWIQEIKGFIDQSGVIEEFSGDAELLEEAVGVISRLSGRLGGYSRDGKNDLIPLLSTRFLDCCAEVAVSHLLMEQAAIAIRKGASTDCGDGDRDFYAGKVAAAHYYVRNYLPNVLGRESFFEIEDLTAVELPESSF